MKLKWKRIKKKCKRKDTINIFIKSKGLSEMTALFCIFKIKTRIMFKLLAKLNKWLLPNYTKEQLDLAKATKFQKAVIAWKYFVITRALD